MLIDLGHEVFFYASEGSDIQEYCNSDRLHYIQTHTLEDIAKDYGDGYNLDSFPSVGYNFQNCDFRHDFSSERKPSTLKFYKNCIEKINEIKQNDDFLLCSQGYYHKPISDAVKLFLTCEPGIGYRGSVASNFRAFESAYIQNFTYGSEHPFECINGSYYDRVIPNYFDDNDIEFSAEKEDYYLFIGRMIKRKGIITAYLTAKALNKKLIIAGQGGIVLPNGNLTAIDEPDFEIPPATWEYVGYADVETRKKLMSKAKLAILPTEYLECFGGTTCECALSGTPVLTSNFGCFPGTILPGMGYHCDTLDDFVYYAKKAEQLDNHNVRASAEKYLMQNVKWEYQKWFSDLYQVYLSSVSNTPIGWNYIRPEIPEWRNYVAKPYLQ